MSPNEIVLQSDVENKFLTRNVSKIQFFTTITKNGIQKIDVNLNQMKIEMLCINN